MVVKRDSTHGDRSRPSSSTSSRPVVHATREARKEEPASARNVALQHALQHALSGAAKKKGRALPTDANVEDASVAPSTTSSLLKSAEVNAIEVELDSYGHGSPTDRLQFGYAPANPEEAMYYHGTISAREWIASRKRNGRICFVKRQKLHQLNCEPVSTMLKLRRYWSRVNEFGSMLKERAAGLSTDAADAFLDALSRKQGVEVDDDSDTDGEKRVAVPAAPVGSKANKGKK